MSAAEQSPPVAVAFITTNTPFDLVALWAIWLSGNTAVPLGGKGAEIEDALRDAGSRLIVAADATTADQVGGTPIVELRANGKLDKYRSFRWGRPRVPRFWYTTRSNLAGLSETSQRPAWTISATASLTITTRKIGRLSFCTAKVTYVLGWLEVMWPMVN